jgi:diacylglycerol O-acyltransferase / wax synthase
MPSRGRDAGDSLRIARVRVFSAASTIVYSRRPGMPRYAYDRLSVVDSSFLAIESAGSHQHIAVVALFDAGPVTRPDGGLEFDRIRDSIESRLHLIPRYRQRLAHIPLGNRVVWVDDEHFNIAYHVRHSALPRPGDEEQLKRLAARIVSQALDREKPLWEIWIVEGLECGRFAMIAKTHHCMIDGISGVDLMSVLLSLDASSSTPHRAPRWIPRPGPTALQLLRDELWRRVHAPARALTNAPAALCAPVDLVVRVWTDISALVETLGAASRRTSPTPLNCPIGPHRRVDWLDMRLADVKHVKDRLGGTVNDVVLATVAGALRRFFERRRVDPDHLEIRANVPVSIRATDARGTLGNQIALWMTDLPVDEPDPVVRLARVRRATAALKRSKKALGAQVLAAVSDWTSATLLSLAVRLTTRSRPFNLVVTNVPGPQLPLYLLGAQLRRCYPVVNLLANQGLGVALFSYDGWLCWGFVADWDLVPDLPEFAAAVAESLAELQAAAARETLVA